MEYRKTPNLFVLRGSLSASEYKESSLFVPIHNLGKMLFAEKGKTLRLFFPGIFHDLTLMKCFDISPSGEGAKGGKFGEHDLHP